MLELWSTLLSLKVPDAACDCWLARSTDDDAARLDSIAFWLCQELPDAIGAIVKQCC